MKKFFGVFFVVALLAGNAFASDVRISYSAWVKVREVHAIYEEYHGRKWGGMTKAGTDEFMKHEMFPFIYGLAKKQNPTSLRRWLKVSDLILLPADIAEPFAAFGDFREVLIPYEAWVQLREVHALYVECSGRTWGGVSGDSTDMFLRTRLLSFVDLLVKR